MADAFVSALQRHFEPLRLFPDSGAPRDHLQPGLRVVFHQRYAIYYRHSADALVILRVVHGARDINALIDGDPEPKV